MKLPREQLLQPHAIRSKGNTARIAMRLLKFQQRKSGYPHAVWLKPRPLLLIGSLLATIGLLFNLPPSGLSQRITQSSLNCQEPVQEQQALSRQQLALLMSIPERSSRRRVQQILKTPYCRLTTLNIRAGAKTERQVYRLAFDSQTFLVVLYEGQNYVGYGFNRS